MKSIDEGCGLRVAGCELRGAECGRLFAHSARLHSRNPQLATRNALPWRILLACALALFLSPNSTARADDTAVQVATVNGFPVFHSKVLVSRVKDDIDRALLLQEYEKNEAAGLPEDLVERTIRKIVLESYGGDESKLIKELAAHKITPEDFKQFTGQELVLAAMLTNYDKQIKAGWLQELRKNADIQKVK